MVKNQRSGTISHQILLLFFNTLSPSHSSHSFNLFLPALSNQIHKEQRKLLHFSVNSSLSSFHQRAKPEKENKSTPLSKPSNPSRFQLKARFLPPKPETQMKFWLDPSFSSNGSLQFFVAVQARPRAAVAAPGPRFRRLLLPCAALLRHGLHPVGRFARRIRPPDAAPLRCWLPSPPPASGGGRDSWAGRGGVPRRYGWLHAVRGSEAEQPAEQGNELLQGEALSQAGRVATLLDSAAGRVPGAGAVAGELAQGVWCVFVLRVLCRVGECLSYLCFVNEFRVHVDKQLSYEVID